LGQVTSVGAERKPEGGGCVFREWAEIGALCINSNNAARYLLAAALDPACVLKVNTNTLCGTKGFQATTLLIDELP